MADEAEESAFEDLWISAMEFVLNHKREDVMAALSLDPPELAVALSGWFKAMMELPNNQQKPLVELARGDKRVADSFRNATVDTGYTLFVVGIVFGLASKGSMVFEMDDAKIEKIVKDEMSKRSGRLGKTKLVRNRQPQNRRRSR